LPGREKHKLRCIAVSITSIIETLKITNLSACHAEERSTL